MLRYFTKVSEMTVEDRAALALQQVEQQQRELAASRQAQRERQHRERTAEAAAMRERFTRRGPGRPRKAAAPSTIINVGTVRIDSITGGSVVINQQHPSATTPSPSPSSQCWHNSQVGVNSTSRRPYSTSRVPRVGRSKLIYVSRTHVRLDLLNQYTGGVFHWRLPCLTSCVKL
jgi:hypothetical protein